MRKLQSVQALRGLAACMVVFLHAYGWREAANTPIRLGAAGVDIFFVISGFIMATISVGKTPREFLTDRLWRIYPIWWIAVSVWLFVTPLTWPRLGASITLWPSYPDFTFPALLVGWTLSFEMLFYLSFTMALRTRPWVPLALFAVTLVLGQITRAPIFNFIGNPMIFEFLFGVAIAKMPRDGRSAPMLLILALITLTYSPPWLYDSKVAITASVSFYRVLFWGFPVALIVYSFLCLEERLRWPAFAVVLGDASYSIYLFHVGVIRFVHLYWLAEFVLAISFALVVHQLIERPIQRAKLNSRDREVGKMVGLTTGERGVDA